MGNMRLFRWKRALELAIEHRSFIDIVIAYRNKYLEMNGNKEESIDLFLQQQQDESEMNLDWSSIKEKCQREMEKEYAMAGVEKPNGECFEYLSFLNGSSGATKSSKNGRAELEALLCLQSTTRSSRSNNSSFVSNVIDDEDTDTIDID